MDRGVGGRLEVVSVGISNGASVGLVLGATGRSEMLMVMLLELEGLARSGGLEAATGAGAATAGLAATATGLAATATGLAATGLAGAATGLAVTAAGLEEAPVKDEADKLEEDRAGAAAVLEGGLGGASLELELGGGGFRSAIQGLLACVLGMGDRYTQPNGP